MKGAFKEFPTEQQPERIPLSIYNTLSNRVRDTFGMDGQIFIPDAHKKAFGKTTTGDLDVIFVPYDKQNWTKNILKHSGIVAHTKNGPQLMLVWKFGKSQYMIDFILTNPEDFEWRKLYNGYGTLIPAVIGSFARSLRYKFAGDGLHLRGKDEKGVYHNIKLTSDPSKAMCILGLDQNMLIGDELYTPEGVAKWVIESPRFDSDIWNEPPQPDGQTLVVKNKKSHTAAKKRDEVNVCYKIIDKAQKKSSFINENYELERHHLGNEFVDGVLEQIKEASRRSRTVLSGEEIMKALNIPGGPVIGDAKKFLLSQPEFINLTQDELNDSEVKQSAIEMLKNEFIQLR
jgi:hypothetical protein